MKRIDTDSLKANLNIVDVVSRYIQLDKDGTEYSALCPFHGESTPSFKVNPNKQFYHCFGCGASGDFINFVMQIRSIGFSEAVNEITDGKPPTTFETPKPRAVVEEKPEEWQPVLPVPESAPPAPNSAMKKMKGKWVPLDYVTRWAYKDRDGNLLGYDARFEYDGTDGKRKKDVWPQTYCRNVNTGVLEWKWLSFPKPRPLYGLDHLAARPNDIVVVVEGCKTTDAARRIYGDAVFCTWPGGGKGIKFVAWEALRDRKVLLVPDADQPGIDTMCGYADENGIHHKGIADYLNGIAASVKIVRPPLGKSDGSDMADAEKEGWNADTFLAHVKENVFEHSKPAEQPQEHPEDPSFDQMPPDDSALDEEEPFRPLGYDHGIFYYLAGRSAQVVALTAGSHTKLNLLTLAPLDYWLRRFPSKSEVQWDMAVNSLIRRCEIAGVYDSSHVRGRGAWWDDEKSLLHVGNKLIVGGEEKKLTAPDIKYIYEAAPTLHIDMHDPLGNKESHEFVKLCQLLPWEKPVNAKLFAGWVFLAPICGALWWRPHAWITGGAGTGKSWLVTNVVSKCLGAYALYPLSNATEAGIRQSLNTDARPVVYDEAEGEDAMAQLRLQGIMGLMRQASSESGGSIIKGSASGRAMSYRIRSMFLFSSIGLAVQQYADKTRITVLGLALNPAKPKEELNKEFKVIEAKAAELLTPEYCAKLRARAVNMIGVIRANARIFASAGAEVIGTQRLGDQIGTMLAGAWALHSNGVITPEHAKEWITSQDWSDETSLHEVKDEMSCLSHIMEHTVRITGTHSTHERSVGELILIAAMEKTDQDLNAYICADALLRIGIKISGQFFVISNQHSYLKKLLVGTMWGSNWGRILKRVPGADTEVPSKFGAGGTHRGVKIPIDLIL